MIAARLQPVRAVDFLHRAFLEMQKGDKQAIVRRKLGEHLSEKFLRDPRVVRRSKISLGPCQSLNRGGCFLIKIGQAAIPAGAFRRAVHSNRC